MRRHRPPPDTRRRFARKPQHRTSGEGSGPRKACDVGSNPAGPTHAPRSDVLSLQSGRSPSALRGAAISHPHPRGATGPGRVGGFGSHGVSGRATIMSGPWGYRGRKPRPPAVAVMFTDMVGYTALMQADEHLAVDKRDRYVDAIVRHHDVFGGTIVQRLGDGSMSMFPARWPRCVPRWRSTGAFGTGRSDPDRRPRGRGDRRTGTTHRGRGEHRRPDRVLRRPGWRHPFGLGVRADQGPERPCGRRARSIQVEERGAARSSSTRWRPMASWCRTPPRWTARARAIRN